MLVPYAEEASPIAFHFTVREKFEGSRFFSCVFQHKMPEILGGKNKIIITYTTLEIKGKSFKKLKILFKAKNKALQSCLIWWWWREI